MYTNHTEIDRYIFTAKTIMGPFTYESIVRYTEYEPEVPNHIINDLTGKKHENKPFVKNTKNKLKSKKTNVMKKAFKNVGQGIAKGACKVLGGTHFVLQTSADLVCATEAALRASAFNEEKTKAMLERKQKTINYQLTIATKGMEIHDKAKSKIMILKSKGKTAIVVSND